MGIMLPVAEDLVGLGILVFVLVQQLRARRLRPFPVIGSFLAVIGTISLVILVVKHVVTPEQTAVMVGSLAVTAALAVARGFVTSLWRAHDGSLMRQGGGITSALWLLAIGQHIVADTVLPPGVGIATLSLFFGVSLVAQVVTLGRRAGGAARSDRRAGV